jgi:hypothetical protein
MSEPILERLNRFTPDPGGLDRDALLFAAGRSSARPNLRWKTLAALLGGTQALSLVLLLVHPTRPAGGLSMPVAALPAPPLALEPRATESVANPGIWSARHRLDESEPEDRPTDTLTLIDSEPPLRAFTPTPSPLSN